MAAAMAALPDLDALLKPALGNSTITTCSTRSLTAPGENYGSVMLAVDLQLDDDGVQKELHLVAKMCPTSAFIKQLFNITVTFRKEVDMYTIVLPTLRDFQRRHNYTPLFDSFAKCYGSRLSLDPTAREVDDGCCLLLENVRLQGYDIEERMLGFDLECTRFLVRDLAKFHAIPVAFKLNEPELFVERIYEKMRVPNHTRASFPDSLADDFIREIVERTSSLERYKHHVRTIEAVLKESASNFLVPFLDVVEPYASLVHADFWTNNTMLKKDARGACIANCIVDFQMLIYGNPLADLMFFLYSSVQIDVLRVHYDAFVDLYYETFVQVLRDLHVAHLERFDRERWFQAEIDRCMMRLEMFHCLFMLTPIFARKEKATELSALDAASLNDRSKMDSEKYYERLEFLLDEFVRRGWLKLEVD